MNIRTEDNVLHLLDNPHFELLRHDVTFPLYVEVDEIYNLACPASPILIRLMNSPDEFTGPVNLGNPGEFTMIELAEKIRDLTGSRSALIHQPLPADDPKQRQPDIRLAREQLGWEPTVPLEQGLKPTVAYFENLLRQSQPA